MVFTPSNCRARPSLRRAAPTSAPGSIACVLRSGTSAASRGSTWPTGKPRRISSIMACRLGPLRWSPPPIPTEALTFVTGMRTMTTAGDVNTQTGMAAHIYFVDRSHDRRLFLQRRRRTADRAADRRRSTLHRTRPHCDRAGRNCGHPTRHEIQGRARSTAPRAAMCARITARNSPFPNRGPIGANCLANPRDFKTPVAAFEDKETPCRLTVKWCGGFHRTRDRPFAARRRRLARQLRALQI